MPPLGGQRQSFFPKADAAVLQSKYEPPSQRPDTVGPVFDVEHADKALQPWSQEVRDSVYPSKTDVFGPAPIPRQQQCTLDRYLFPVLTQNERLRLTMLWYYTRGSLEDTELQSRLQEKVFLAQETIGWEFVIVGLLDHNTYTRLVTVGLPLAVLPRRESTCAHTVNQPPQTVFILPNMKNDWRFSGSPHVDIGGLRAYAGAPLRFETEFGDCVALGSLCVASNTEQEPLSRAQQLSLVRLADWVVADIIHSARARRQRERRRMLELIANTKQFVDDESFDFEDAVLDILKKMYPEATINIQASQSHQILLEGREPISAQDLEHGLWEDCEYFDYFIENLNHQNLARERVVRVVAAECVHAPLPTFLVVASKDFKLVFDDVDSWFVQTCSSMLSQIWQTRLLKEAMRAKERFLRGITHQLRTPIHGILGSVELLAEELKSRNLWDESLTTSITPTLTPGTERLDPFAYINTIRASGRDLISTVNSMIKLNRWTEIAQAARSDALHRFTELETELMGDLNQALSGDLLTRSSLFFNYNLPSDCDSLTVDMGLLKDCILPLVINGLQHTINGIVAITVSVSDDYQTLTIDVQDTGLGIHPKDQQRIFDAYEKVDTHTTGAGLGLTLASRVATLLNGSITLLSSDIRQGSHFKAVFKEPNCACSPKPLPCFKERFRSLTPTFHCVDSFSGPLCLRRCFVEYLTTCGLTASDTVENSLLVLESASDPDHLRTSLSLVTPEQVAICLVPVADTNMDFSRIRRDNNIIYVKAPFLSSTLLEAISHADSVLYELAQAKAISSIDAALILPLPPSNPTSPTPQPLRTHDGTQSPPTTALQTLHLDTKPIQPIYAHIQKTTTFSALLVDDNAINLRIMQMYCNKRGIPYLCASDGLQAVSIFSARQSLYSSSSPSTPNTNTSTSNSTTSNSGAPIELILMDLQMPLCDGIEACTRIRQLEERNGWPKSVIFIVTGQDSLEDRGGAEKAGADRYFVKPVGPKVLDAGIRGFFPEFQRGG